MRTEYGSFACGCLVLASSQVTRPIGGHKRAQASSASKFSTVDMCSMSCYILHMARGTSGRLVFDVDPAVKRRLHARLATDGRTGKDWLMEQIERYLNQPVQEPLPFLRAGGKSDG